LKLGEFVDKFGQPFSEMLGIDLKSRRKEEIAKWLLASILYGKPIRESSATATYRVFEENGVLTGVKVLQTGWDGLVALLDEGGYTRYDFSTADRLLEIFRNLEKDYSGDLNHLYASATDEEDLEKKLKDLGRGIGDTTVSIFLREMRVAWTRARPHPSPLVKMAMQELQIKNLEEFAKKKDLDIVSLETALLRLGKNFLKKGKHLEIEVQRRK
jgi:hypothetical protein